jgi:hypothetical protein
LRMYREGLREREAIAIRRMSRVACFLLGNLLSLTLPSLILFKL